MRKRRRFVLQLAAAAAVLAALPHVAAAQGSYPTRPVRFIVGQAAGGSSDITARLTTIRELQQQLAGHRDEIRTELLNAFRQRVQEIAASAGVDYGRG